MFNQVTYNVLIERFKAFAAGHYKIERFSHGQIDVTDIDKDQHFPWMHVVPVSIAPTSGSRSFTLDVVFADMPRDKENKTEYQRESLSDCIQIAEDLLAEIKNGNVIFGEDVTLEEGAAVQPFMEEYTHTLTGVTLSLTMTFPWNWNACDIPADWTTGGSSGGGSGGGGGTSLVLKVNNIDNVIQNILDLVDGTNTTIEDLGDGRVRINSSGVVGSVSWGDIIGNIADQLDLAIWFNEKADITSLAEVAFSGDYTDLVNTPSIPAAQVNSDWNASSGLAQILNKPTLATVATSGSYIDLTNQPTIPAAQIQSDWTQANSAALDFIKNKPTLPATIGDMLKSVYDTDVDGVVDAAERIEIVVRNSTGATLLKGQIVYLSGATGNRPNAVLADASTEATSSKTIGFVVANIANNSDGNVAVNGTLHDLDTSAFSAGDTLWLSETAGAWQANTPPAEPAHAVFLGYVARSHPTLGRVVIQIQNGYELNELHGVQITSVAANDVFMYDAPSTLWKNKTIADLKILLGLAVVSGRAVLATDFTTVGTAFQNVTGLSFSVTAGKTYKWRATILIIGNVATNGTLSTFGVSGTTTYRFTGGLGVSTNNVNNGNANNQTNSQAISLALRIATADGIYIATASGTVGISVVSTVAAAITLKAGSVIEYDEVV